MLLPETAPHKFPYSPSRIVYSLLRAAAALRESSHFLELCLKLFHRTRSEFNKVVK